jgi:8-oxo-dGTP pyrophosphatase MutT (NUDIX family)
MDPMISDVRTRLEGRLPRRVHEADTWEAAVALILVPGNSDLEILFIKRAERTGDPWSGQMGLPGGRRDPEDGELLDTALRETGEETAIALSSADLLGELDDLFPNIKILPQVIVRPFVFGLSKRPEINPSEEVAGHVWVALGGLRASATRTEVDVPGYRRTVDAFVVGEHVIWGMTHRIIMPFLDLLT